MKNQSDSDLLASKCIMYLDSDLVTQELKEITKNV